MKNFYAILFFALIGCNIGYSTSTPIPQENYIIQSFSSDNTNHPVSHAFDEDPATWWAIFNSEGFSLPGIVEVDLGSVYDVSGFAYTPNPANSSDKAIGYEIYLSTDGTNWGTVEASGNFNWTTTSDVSPQNIYFGAISAQFVKMVYTSSQNTGNGNIHTGDLFFYESDIPATGQMNQILSFDPVSPKFTSDLPFELSANTTSGLPISYSIVSGPASVSGNSITLNGTGGIVEVKEDQAGDTNYYSASAIQSFEVIDLNAFDPIVSTRLTEDYPIEMPALHAYPIYINASIDEPELLSIATVEVEINGNTYMASLGNGSYFYLWTPPSNGDYTINITATGTNGNQTTITRNITVTDDINSQNITTLKDVVIEFGGTNSRWYTGTYTMPQHVGSYDQIMANLTIECPNGNCDDWDRWAFIDIKDPSGNWIQIIRYITPYNVACNHQIDLTDYASLLQGEFEFRMFIDTWGTGGWQVTLDFEHEKGTPDYLYSNVDEIWDGTWDLGNPSNLQPVDTVNYSYKDNVESAHLRLSTTGHGWGQNNSQNAAEFYHATNFIDVDGTKQYTQILWNDCDPNPDNCTNQQGTWHFSRAGWCPGAISPPNIIYLDEHIDKESIELIYRFDPSYIDYCHPNNPNCFSGSTCPDCNDGYKAIYVIDGHIISFSDTPIFQDLTGVKDVDNTISYNLDVFPNPSKGAFSLKASNLEGESRVYIQKVSGEVIKTFNFQNPQELNSYLFDLGNQTSGAYFINIENKAGTGSTKLILD